MTVQCATLLHLCRFSSDVVFLLQKLLLLTSSPSLYCIKRFKYNKNVVILPDNTQAFLIGIVLYSTTGANNKKYYIYKHLFIYCFFKDNDCSSVYVLQHLMTAELVKNECKGIKSTRSWNYFSQCFDIAISLLRRNMIHQSGQSICNCCNIISKLK